MAGEPCVALGITEENAKVLGSVWMVSGNLGQVKFSTGRVGGSLNLNVWLDLSDLTEFTIPNPWYEAFGLVRKLQDGVDDLEDSAEIKQHELFSKK